jgi:uncharacterized membrane protein
MVFLIIIYIIFVILISAYFTHKVYGEKIEVFEDIQSGALIVVLFAMISPLLTLTLMYFFGDASDLKDAGPIGDWIGGSTVPFLTFATFLIAFATF